MKKGDLKGGLGKKKTRKGPSEDWKYGEGTKTLAHVLKAKILENRNERDWGIGNLAKVVRREG